MTRELKLALIVGFALVLVVTVLISDHLSHARQTRLAALPPDPVKMTEPPPIALESGAGVLPQPLVTEPTPVAPAPLIGSSPMSDIEPLVITQGSGASPMSGMTPPPVEPARAVQLPQDGPILARQSDPIIAAVERQGGRVEGGTIYLPGVQVARETTPQVVEVPAPIAPARPVAAAPAGVPDRIHTVVSGDSVFKLSAKYYGDGKVWRKVARYNGLAEEPAPALKVGQKLKFPAAEVLLGRAAPAETVAPRVALGKTRSYTVKKGDTLAEIAQRELGTVKRAREILELNKGVIKSADRIPLGATIQLPG